MAPSKHNAENCDQKPPVCDICHKRHLTALHMETTPDHKEKPNAPEAKNTSTACTQVCGEEETSRSCARIVLVQASHQSNPARKLTTYAVLDDQSTDVFNSDSLLEQLEVDAPEVDLQVSTIVGSNSIRTKKVTGLSFQDTENGYAPIKVPFAYSREFIPASHKDIATPQVAKQWKHLSHIADRIQHRPDVDIGLLIGRNVPAAFQPIKVIFGHNEEPWAIIGRVCKDKHSRTNAASVNRVTVEREMLLDSCEEVPITPPFKNLMSSKDLTSPKQVREMMELDYSEIHHTRKMRGTEQSESIEDKRFREILTKGLHKNVNGNWEAPLPFKSDDLSLPDNKGYCLRRLLNDSNLKEDYASRVPDDQLSTEKGKAWFLPHFNVYHPRKPDQIRVVFDCSAVFENESLNKHLLQGPDQLNSLTGVLTRFRKEKVAFTCDIEQMFHSFYVNPEDRNFLRFLWFENNDLTKPIVKYQMNVHLFGAASSPGVANFCLHQTAETHRRDFGNITSDFLLRDFYVDDGLKSVPTAEQALQLIKDAQTMCARDNLRLHKFASNSKEVLEALPVNDRAKDLKDLDLRHDAMPVQRSLGTYWCIESDTFGFHIELRNKPVTRRGILSTISSVYDPLGAVSPVILNGKQILQALCRQNVSWDDPRPDDILPLWEK